MEKVAYTARVDLDVSARDLVETWINGNRNEVIKALTDDHPGLTALFLHHALEKKGFDRSDFNTVVNRLIDYRIGIST